MSTTEASDAWHQATAARNVDGVASLGPRYVSVDASFASRLATTQRRRFEVEDSAEAFVPEAAEGLGPDALAPVGTEVRPGTPLIGRVHAIDPLNGGPLFLAMFGCDSDNTVLEAAVRAPVGLHGTVVEASRTRLDDGRQRAVVEVEVARPLDVGDVLQTRDGARLVVVQVSDLPTDLVCDAAEGPLEVMRVASARDRLAGFGGSAGTSMRTQSASLSIVSEASTDIPEDAPAVSRQRLDRFAAAGSSWLIWELAASAGSASVRTDTYNELARCNYPSPQRAELPVFDRMNDGKTALDRFFAPIEPTDPDEAPGVVTGKLETATRLLLAAGFAARPGAHQPDVRRLTDEEVDATSRGPIENAFTLDPNSRDTVDGGLFCQRLFGPTRSNRCACGRQTDPKTSKRCDVCGVELISASERNRRFAHVPLPHPIAHPWFLENIATLLELDGDRLRGVAAGDTTLTGETPDAPERTGGQVLHAALSKLNLHELAKAEGPRGELARAMLEGDLSPTQLMLRELLVTPAGTRIPATAGPPLPPGTVLQRETPVEELDQNDRVALWWKWIDCTEDDAYGDLEIRSFKPETSEVDIDELIASDRFAEATNLRIESWNKAGTGDDYTGWIGGLIRNEVQLRELALGGRDDDSGRIGAVAPLVASLKGLRGLSLHGDLEGLSAVKGPRLENIDLQGPASTEGLRDFLTNSDLPKLDSLVFNVEAEDVRLAEVFAMLGRYRVEDAEIGGFELTAADIAALAELPRKGLRRRPALKRLALYHCEWALDEADERPLVDAILACRKTLASIELELPCEAEEFADEFADAGLAVEF